jgi:hypothetical protein
MSSIRDTISSVLSTRDRDVRQLADATEELAAAGQKLAAERKAAQDAVDLQNEPQRRLERAQAAEYHHGVKRDQTLGPIANRLRDPAGWPVELRKFVHQLSEFRRAWSIPIEPSMESVGAGYQRLTNAGAFRRRDEAIRLLMGLEVELRDTLWRLDATSLRQRLAEIRRQMAAFDRDDLPAVEDELEDESAPAPEATAQRW